MDYDEDKVDEMVLALLYLTSFNEQGFVRAWKGPRLGCAESVARERLD